MKRTRIGMLAGLFAVFALASAARAETTVELKGVHLCCGACVKAVQNIAKETEGVKTKCDREGKTVTITAPDAKLAQKVLNDLATGGFHGETGNKELVIKDDSGAAKGKVKSVTVSGLHNCCGSCTRAIKESVKKVDGVTADSAKAKVRTFEVTGDFDASELVKALNAAGFHVQVKK